MAYQTVFKRYEIKYLLTKEQKEKILRIMKPYMTMDRYGESTIRNIYYDTDDYILARHSIAKPDFKEKLRIRSYTRVREDDTVFVELKRKFDGVVYKRRMALPEVQAMNWTTERNDCNEKIRGSEVKTDDSQIKGEIQYFLNYYSNLRPAVFLSYEREAYRMRKDVESSGGSDFRVTFDKNILCRETDLSLESEVYGKQLLDPGFVLMELKCSGGIPRWMVQILSEEKIYKTSFSKYGRAYSEMIHPELLKIKAASAQERKAEQQSEKQNMMRPARLTLQQRIRQSVQRKKHHRTVAAG